MSTRPASHTRPRDPRFTGNEHDGDDGGLFGMPGANAMPTSSKTQGALSFSSLRRSQWLTEQIEAESRAKAKTGPWLHSATAISGVALVRCALWPLNEACCSATPPTSREPRRDTTTKSHDVVARLLRRQAGGEVGTSKLPFGV